MSLPPAKVTPLPSVTLSALPDLPSTYCAVASAVPLRVPQESLAFESSNE